MSRKLILASTVAMILAGPDVSALGLGGLAAKSVLNQPFLGEIELNDVKPDEIDTVKASIASQEAFSKAGLERYYYLTKLNFTPEISPQGNAVIRVSSREPIREPYMDFLVQVVWSSGQLVKEYTVLLNPPILSNRTAPGVDVARAAGARPGHGTKTTGAARTAYAPAPGDGFPVYLGPVRSGSSLWAIATENRPAGATAAQTAMALYRNNQHAFIRGNVNRLRSGVTLVIPTKAELFAIDASAADREYAAALRGRAVRRAPVTDIPPEALDSRLRIAGAAPQPTPNVRQSLAGGLPAAERTLSQGGDASGAGAAAQQDALLALETSESTRQETVELRNRIKELETQLSDIEALLKLRNDELAQVQRQPAPGVIGEQPPSATAEPAAGQPAAAAAQGELPPADAAALPPDAAPADDARSLSPTAEAGADAAGQPDSVAAAAPTESQESLLPVPDPNMAAAETVAAPADDQNSGSPSADSAAATPAVVEAPPPAEEPTSTWHSLLLPLAGLAGVTALGILAFSWNAVRRRRREEEEGVDSDTDLSFEAMDETTEARTMAHSETDASTVGVPKGLQDPHLGQTSTHSKDEEGRDSGMTRMSSLTNFDAETDEADVLSEADIYIAYGRHAEAQELLRAELRRYPDRVDIQYKLAEALAGARDPQGLGDVMRDIQSAGGDRADPGMWRRLQDLQSKLQTGHADRPPAAGGSSSADIGDRAKEPSDPLEDSIGLGLDDSFSLDISDLQSSGVALSKETDPRKMAGMGQQGGGGAPQQTHDDLIMDLGGFDLLDDTDSQQDSFGSAPTVAIAGIDGESRRSDIDNLVDSELELTLDGPRVEVVDDLDSIFDSSAADEPTLARSEMTGSRPSAEKAGAVASSITLDSSDAEGLSPDQESVPTDLLSSQWQMDSGIWDETATKLDLARAYIEMDDGDAAREILEEVISEGREEQRSEARAMLEKLA